VRLLDFGIAKLMEGAQRRKANSRRWADEH